MRYDDAVGLDADNDDDAADDDAAAADDDDIYIMMKCVSVTKNHHFLKRSVCQP